MLPYESTAYSPAEAAVLAELPPGGERRFEARREVTCDLWMIDHHGSTVLRCHCADISRNGMRLRVPLGYGIAEGQRYELRSHLPGSRVDNSLGLVGSRWATVVRSQVCVDGVDDHLEIGVVLDVEDVFRPRMIS
jgi:hypothetical protein